MFALALTLWGSPARADDVLLVLNDPTGRPAPMDSCDAEVCSTLEGLIRKSTKTIDLALYGLRGQTALLDALRDAKARGVRLRAVVDMDVNNENYYSDTDELMKIVGDVKTDFEVDFASKAAQKDYLGTAFRCERPEGFAGPLQCLAFDLGDRCWIGAHASREPIVFQGDIMHNKFAVVDGRYVWTGSTNASDSCTGGYNANLVTVVDSPLVAGWYTNEFEQMHKGFFHATKQKQPPMRADLHPDLSVQVLFSPQHKPITEAVRPLIQSARSSIDVAVFFLTHKEIAQDLLNAHQRGVKVRVLLDATAATNEYTKHEVLRLGGIPVKVEDFGGKMHAKSAVIDDEYVITGSMNWTSAGERGNDENTIILRSGKLARQYRSWFQTVWERVDNRWLTANPIPESRDSGFACMDGTDNDFDHKDDAEDEGCSATPPPVPMLPAGKIVPKPKEGCRLP
jgi:phosphatidylserine/phosphatidylglycerophosphate/cardiolipin synthase-like enzyme